ncbi:brain-specific angiogenesis inhibitor 1-associated protein 2-like protein 2 [Scophthalmus maximus]|uniref:brain-specific angiogenesis inhibitor 1-associated protein 2-like protein 2 n=1 Tax=Scophthalmus maximus TaxID=52904 RepID=UPI001FA8D4FC|nr:brain-specific angiogenesis inhibitor 1-associated protein 2-like protein 2 [Scophthalmus maximus]XP_035470780.2 brain-specific angiogenesis inhibitor 1-associated protein 2-like protein 2 [Scophthalmus maximus]
MSRMNSDQLHRSTLGIYSSLMDEFNPSLQKLVSLGNSYVRAFNALAVTSEAYFSALAKIGEKAFNTASLRSLGDVLIQISESQRSLTLELDGVFRWFSMEVLQEMDNNVRLDRDYISGSRNHYEMEVHNQAVALERHLRRGTNQDSSEYVQFLRESHGEALKEEERRYRFLAEKHCGLIQSIARLMNKIGGSFQQNRAAWTEEVNATREPEARRRAAVDDTMEVKREEIRKSREDLRLGKIPSRAPSPQESISRSLADSVGGGGGAQYTRALVAHQPAGSNPTLLPFDRGELITVMVQQPRNGWLYGRADSSSRQGWFPASFVEPVDDPPKSTSSRNSTLRGSSSSSSSMSNLFDQQRSSSHSGAAPPPPPPPPPPTSPLSSYQHSEMQPLAPTPDRRAESNVQNKRSQPHGSQPSDHNRLFPRGTNPFATVKLKPTATNDRSSPCLYRR